ncbi:MAG: myo-inosose-2 dehydratase [Anaerolineae bacterium]
MKIGIQTRPWGPELNRNNLSQILGEVAAAGYDGFEIGAQHLDLSRPAALSDLAASHGLRVVGIHVGGEIHNPESVRAALAQLETTVAFATAAGADFIPFSGKLKPNKSAAELAQQAANLNRLGELCSRHGLTLCYHNHHWEIESDCAELRHICAHTDPALVSLCLDVGWVQRAGGQPLAVVQEFLPRVGYFHLKDTTAAEWREVGHGDVDFAALLPWLKARFDGWLVVEQDDTQRAPAESARISRDFLRAQL